MRNQLSHWLRLPRNISSMALFTLFTALIISNFVVLVAYTVYSQHETQLADADEVIIHLANTLHLLEISSESEWVRIAKVSETENLSIVLTEKALFPVRVEEYSLKQIHNVLKGAPEKFSMSILLPNKQWLNIKFQPNVNAYLVPLLILFLAFVVAVALLFSAWSLVRFTKPLKNFKRAAEQLGVELRADPVVEYGPAIVRETAYAMNQMQKRIRTLLDDRNYMLAAISHDLRTPITRLKLRAHFVNDPEQHQEIISDLTEMELMIDQILAYTKDARSEEPFIDLDLAALILSLCDEKCEQGFEVNCTLPVSRLPYKGRALSLKRAFTNLLNNAVKYAKHVEVIVEITAQQIRILIDDDGPGIPETHLTKVFTPFYRLDSSRSSKTGGTGLGLAIVQDIINAHQGSIQLQNRQPVGFRVVVTLLRG